MRLSTPLTVARSNLQDPLLFPNLPLTLAFSELTSYHSNLWEGISHQGLEPAPLHADGPSCRLHLTLWSAPLTRACAMSQDCPPSDSLCSEGPYCTFPSWLSLPFLWAACRQVKTTKMPFRKLHVFSVKMYIRSPFGTWLQSSECLLLIPQGWLFSSTENKFDVCKVPHCNRGEPWPEIEGPILSSEWQLLWGFLVSSFIRGLVMRIQQNEVVMKIKSKQNKSSSNCQYC